MTLSTLSRSEARELLIEALCEDQAASFFSDSDGPSLLAARFRDGFSGFDSMSDSELLACAHDSGIAQSHPELLSALRG